MEVSGESSLAQRPEVSVASGSAAASIGLLGAYVRHLSLGGVPVIKPSNDGSQTHGGIAVLMPYAGRVRGGRYAFRGKEFQLPTGRDGHAIHGFAKDAMWKVRARTADSVSIGATLRGRGYPGTLAASITYAVKGRTFSTDCAIRNAGRSDAPVVVGFHPYLAAMRWTINSSSRSYHYQLADGYFPTGKKTPCSFEGVGPKSKLDDCFSSPGTIRLLAGGMEVALRRRRLPYLVVYNGKYAEGRSVAIEPYSGLPDAYNNGIGLRTLAPGQTFECGYDLVLSRSSPMD